MLPFQKNVNATSDILLPDGRKANSLKQAPLYRELAGLGVDVKPDMGKAELIGIWESAITSKIEAMRRDNPKLGRTPNVQLIDKALASFGSSA